MEKQRGRVLVGLQAWGEMQSSCLARAGVTVSMRVPKGGFLYSSIIQAKLSPG